MTYRVELDSYSGPLDILLYLIRKTEIDIFEVTISQIIDQYLQFLKDHLEVDVNSIGEFLILVTSLLEIKSKLILPREELDLEETFQDPRFNLVKELLEYRKFKNISSFLESRDEEEGRKFCPVSPELPLDEKDLAQVLGQVLNDIDIWDIFHTYHRFKEEIIPPPLEYSEIPIEDIMEDLQTTLHEKKRIEILTLLRGKGDLSWVAGAFIALLELIRQGKFTAHQEEPFGEIWLTVRDEVEG